MGGTPRAAASVDPSRGLTDDYWLEMWAFGTSSVGLALTDSAFWHLTPREFTALRKLWDSAHGMKKEEPGDAVLMREFNLRMHNARMRCRRTWQEERAEKQQRKKHGG